MRHPSRAAAAIALLSALALGVSGGVAFAADDEEGPPANPAQVAIPYHGVYEAAMATGWTVESCDSLTAPDDIIFTCEPETMTFSAEEYDPDFEPVPFPVAIVNGSQRLVVTYIVSHALPVAPAVAEGIAYPYPFAAGSRVLLPYSDLGLTCEGCDTHGPQIEVLGVEPATAGTARATPTHLEIMPNTGFVGTLAVGLTLTDPFGQQSTAGSVLVSFYGRGDATLTALHVVVPADEPVIDLTALVIDSDDDADLHLLGCGVALYGTVTCANGVATYTPAAEWPGIDQFSFHVLSGTGEQATGSITIVDAEHARELALGLVVSSDADAEGTIVPSTPVAEDEAVAGGFFAPLQSLLDRVTGRADNDETPTDEDSE
jgi:hypothetical protein